MTPFLAKAILTTVFLLAALTVLIFHRLSRRNSEQDND